MNAENIAKIALENKGRFDPHAFVEYYVMKAIKAAAFVGGRDCTIDLRGPSHDKKYEIIEILKGMGYSVSDGMKYRGYGIITISWYDVMDKLEHPERPEELQPEPGHMLRIEEPGEYTINGCVTMANPGNVTYTLRFPDGYQLNQNAVAGQPLMIEAGGRIAVNGVEE